MIDILIVVSIYTVDNRIKGLKKNTEGISSYLSALKPTLKSWTKKKLQKTKFVEKWHILYANLLPTSKNR